MINHPWFIPYGDTFSIGNHVSVHGQGSLYPNDASETHIRSAAALLEAPLSSNYEIRGEYLSGGAGAGFIMSFNPASRQGTHLISSENSCSMWQIDGSQQRKKSTFPNFSLIKNTWTPFKIIRKNESILFKSGDNEINIALPSNHNTPAWGISSSQHDSSLAVRNVTIQPQVN